MKRAASPCVVAIALSVLLSAPRASLAQAESKKDQAPPKVVTVKIATRAPDPEKWNFAKNADGTRRMYTCKPLSCSMPESVMFIFQKGSMTPPTQEWLENYAKVELPKTIRAAAAARAVMSNQSEKVETLQTQTATLKNYPSALNETRLTSAAATFYVEVAIVFAGPVIIRIESKSTSQDLAKNSLQGFIQEIQIVETPGLPPGTAVPARPRAPKTQEL